MVRSFLVVFVASLFYYYLTYRAVPYHAMYISGVAYHLNVRFLGKVVDARWQLGWNTGLHW